MKKKGLLSYKERRAQITSVEAQAMPLWTMMWAPMKKSKVVVPPEVQSSLSTGGLPLAILDHPIDQPGPPTPSGVGDRQVIYGGSQDAWASPDPQWHTKDWLEHKVTGMTEEDVP